MTLLNADRLPPETLPVLGEHVDVLTRVLRGRLVGVYVHGSAATGGFSPAQSDLDYLAVVAGPLTSEERALLCDAFLLLHGKSGFRKGVEMSIVEARFAGSAFRYPTPYEFHFGTVEQIRHHGRPHDHEHLDPDLASHFTIARERGVCVHGEETRDVFAPVDRKFFLQSNLLDLEASREAILRDPVYAILNLCRTVFYLRSGAIASKEEGGAAFVSGERFGALVRTALMDYRSGRVSDYDGNEIRAFSDSMMSEIERHLSGSG